MDLYTGLLLVGYYVLAGGVLWTVVMKDYAATCQRLARTSDTAPGDVADAFLRRVARLVGALAGGGVGLLLPVLDPPLVSAWWIAPIAASDALVTWALVLVGVRVLRGRFGVDIVAEMRHAAS